MGATKALSCRFCKRTTPHLRVATDGDLRLMECQVCFAKDVQRVGNGPEQEPVE